MKKRHHSRDGALWKLTLTETTPTDIPDSEAREICFAPDHDTRSPENRSSEASAASLRQGIPVDHHYICLHCFSHRDVALMDGRTLHCVVCGRSRLKQIVEPAAREASNTFKVPLAVWLALVAVALLALSLWSEK